MLSFNDNPMAVNAAGNAGSAQTEFGKMLKQIVTAMRINSAADDASGLAVRELLRADIATARQGSENTQMGLAMLQTAEGSLSAISSLLVRAKELVTQSMGGMLSEDQKGIIGEEVKQIIQEINRISGSTEFNGIQLHQNKTINIELGDGDKVALNMADITMANVDLNKPVEAMAIINDAINVVSEYRGSLGASMNRLEAASNVLDLKAENLLAAESRISDADMAKSLTELVVAAIGLKSAIAAQTHSSSIANSAMSLLT